MLLGYNNLKVWKKSYNLTLKIYEITKSFPDYEIYGIISQMRRAATSIIANIAEGYGKKKLTGYIHYISIAISSCNELGVYIRLSRDLKYVKKDECEYIESVHEEIIKMLFGLKKSLELKNSEEASP